MGFSRLPSTTGTPTAVKSAATTRRTSDGELCGVAEGVVWADSLPDPLSRPRLCRLGPWWLSTWCRKASSEASRGTSHLPTPLTRMVGAPVGVCEAGGVVKRESGMSRRKPDSVSGGELHMSSRLATVLSLSMWLFIQPGIRALRPGICWPASVLMFTVQLKLVKLRLSLRHNGSTMGTAKTVPVHFTCK